MIDIYNSKTSYRDAMGSNGLYQLDKLVISAETNEDIYGNYELNISLELQGDAPTGLYDLIEIDNIIKVKDEGNEELFRITTVDKGLETIEIYARHITISDSLNLWLDNVKPTNLDGMSALQWLAQRTTPKCNLILSSNISKRATADYVRKNLYEALVDGDNSFLSRWGGEISRHGYTIEIKDKLGQDKTNSIIVKEALNLTEFNANNNIDDISTVIYPMAFNGIQGDKVVSPLVDKYSMEFPIMIKYEDVKLKETNDQGEVTQEGYNTIEEVKAELKRRAEEEFSKNNLDKLKFEIDIDYIDLSKYEEYKDIAQLQRTNLGDYISVRVDTYDMDITARVVARVYDVLRDKRVNNTISTDGNLKKPQDIKDIIKDVVGDIDINVEEIFKDLGPYIDDMIGQGMKDSYVVLEKNRLLAMDNKDKNLAKKVIVLNKNGLGFSNTGIQGPFTYGFTIDGKINADMITTGLLSGQYIKGGTIEANKLTVNAKNEIREGLATSSKVAQLEADIDGVSLKVGEVSDSVKGNTEKITTLRADVDGVNLKVSDTINGKGNLLSNGVLMGVDKPISWDVGQGLTWDKFNDRNAGIYPNEVGNVERFLSSELIPRPSSGVVSISATLTAEINTYGAQVYIIGARDRSYRVDWANESMSWASGEYTQKSSPNIYIPEWVKYIWVRVDHEGAKSHDGAYYVYIDWINLVEGKYSFNDYGLFHNGINSKVSNLVVETDRISARVEEVNKDKDAKFSSLELTTNGIKSEVGDVRTNLNRVESDYTSFKQDSKKFEFNIESRGTANLIRGASGLKAYQDGNWDVRKYDTDRNPSWDVITGTSTWGYPDPNVYTFQLRERNGLGLVGGDMGIIEHNIKVQRGESYVFSCYVASHRASDVFCYIRGKASSDYELVGSWSGTPSTGGQDKNNWTFIKVPFVAEKDEVHVEVGMRNSTDSDPYVWFAKPMLNKGTIVAPYTDNDREIYSGRTKIDGNGIRCDFDDGTWAEMGRNGFRYKKSNWDHPYQFVTKIVKLKMIQNGKWQTIYLGDEFKGKRIDQDFKLTTYIGAVDCNAFVTTGEYGGALRTSFTEYTNWDSNNASLMVRCCIQKIGLGSRKFFGWDSASTSPGAVIGESAGDIITIAQM